MQGRLKAEVAEQAMRIASRLIVNIARQIADTGYRPSTLKLFPGADAGSDDLELDRTMENFSEDPARGILNSLVSYKREKQKQAFVMVLDYSYSMQSKIVLAAVTAAAIAQHYKRNYAVLAFSGEVCILRHLKEAAGPEKILKRLFSLKSHGETNIRLALENAFRTVEMFERKAGVILTDGDWNKGGDPFPAAARFDRLSVIGFPPAQQAKIRDLALKGGGSFALIHGKREIGPAILKCLN